MGGLDVSWAAAITNPPTASRTNTARMYLANLFIVDPPGSQLDLLEISTVFEAAVLPTNDCFPGFGLSRTELYSFPARMGAGPPLFFAPRNTSRAAAPVF